MLNLEDNSLIFFTLRDENESQHRKNPKLLPIPDFSSMLFSTKLENQKVFSHIPLKLK